MPYNVGLNPLFGGSAFRTRSAPVLSRKSVLIPFLAGLLFGLRQHRERARPRGLNPLFGGSAFRTVGGKKEAQWWGLNPLFGGSAFRTPYESRAGLGTGVLIPFLAGLLFGPPEEGEEDIIYGS